MLPGPLSRWRQRRDSKPAGGEPAEGGGGDDQGGFASIGITQNKSDAVVGRVEVQQLQATYPLAQAAGDTNVVVVAWFKVTANIASVVDSSGNTYRLAVGPTTFGGAAPVAQSVYYAAGIAAAAPHANVVTVTWDAKAYSPDVRYAEYRGLDPTSPFDVGASSKGSDANPSSGPVATLLGARGPAREVPEHSHDRRAQSGARRSAIGMDGIDFNTPGKAGSDLYAVFGTSSTASCGLDVRPDYYGMRLFSLGTAKEDRLLPVTAMGSARVHAWATLGCDGAVRVVLIDEDLTGNDSVKLQVPGKTGAASLVRLTAPSLTAKNGISLGMQTWDGSVDGAPRGTPRPSR